MIDMTDKITKEQRSKVMQSIRAQSKLENQVSTALWKKGLRFRKNVRSLYGTPDISIKKYKLVIFIDSCFWHSCPLHGKMPKSNQEFWQKKLQRNVEHDKEVTSYYLDKGWNIMRIWEHDIRGEFNQTIDDILSFVEKIKQ
jgi:DNA mismatch endonuclease (patch repair protein)